jgi:hypothetical protein
MLKVFEPLMHSNSHQKLSKNCAVGQFEGRGTFSISTLGAALPVGSLRDSSYRQSAMDANTHRPTWKTLLAFAIIYFVWGSAFLAIRIGVREVPPFLLAAMRFLIAGLILYGWTIARGERIFTRASDLRSRLRIVVLGRTAQYLRVLPRS